jgi:hypothetical protein
MPMNKFWKRKWVEALESGEYKQVTLALKSVRNKRTEGMCCLGVLCDVAGAKWKRPGNIYSESSDRVASIEAFDLSSDLAELSPEMLEFFGITEEQQRKLVSMNDDQHKSFAEIAAYIKKKL